VTFASSIFFAVATVFSVLNWVAVGRKNSVLEYVSKPASTVAFLFVLATVDVVHDAPWGWRIAAFVFCLLGDVFLMLPRDAFVPGLASFAIAQMLFAISFTTGETSGGRALVGFLIVLPIAALLARRFIRAIRITGPVELVAPVAVYMVVISGMTIAAIAEGSPVAIAGAAIFMMSDSLIAETRFVKARAWHPVGIMATYHVALAGLALGVL
jgi:uncharacterized membrane protein YhhN